MRLIELFALAAREQLEIHPRRCAPRRRDCGADRPQRARGPARQRLVPGSADLHPIARDGAALDERGRRVRPLRSRLRPGRRADAVRHVPSLYGRRAFDPRDRPARGDRARRAEGRSSAVDRDHPKQIASRRVLYVAVLLHDIAKGRGGDHSVSAPRSRSSSARASASTRPRPRRSSWLVRYHLLMSSTAFKRDLADPKTIEDFVRQVQSPERLRLLLILTVVDIRAVGPGVWNEWKRTLLRTLFEAAEERLRLGHKQHGRAELVAAAPGGAGRRARLEGERRARPCAAPARQLLARRAARLAGRQRPPGRRGRSADRRCQAERGRRGRSRERRDAGQRLHARPRRPVLPHLRGLASAGANIIDARIHTTRDGMALDNLLVLDGRGQALFATGACAAGSRASVEAALASAQAPPLPAAEPQRRQQRVRGRAVGRDRRPGVDPHHGGRGQCARPPGAARRPGGRDPRNAVTRSIRRTSRPMASARSTSST